MRTVKTAKSISQRRMLTLAIACALALASAEYASAQNFPASIDLGSLNGSDGFRLDGVTAEDFAGRSVSAAGDINGDGHDDLIIGARGAALGGSETGSSYVVFGKSTPFVAALALSSLNGSNGFRVDGAEDDLSGGAVSAAGDFNGDGIDDLIIGGVGGNTNGAFSGHCYVLFGRRRFGPIIPLSTLNGANGVRLTGPAGSFAGTSVHAAGDVNGDGIGDLIIGANGAQPNGVGSGSSYVVFGKSTPFGASLALANLTGANGFRLDGAAGDNVGNSVSAAGDINNDGFGDLIVSASSSDRNGLNSGSSYVVFGKSTPFAATLELSSLSGANGLRIDGIDEYDFSGHSVSAAGDINGDSYNDVIIGAFGASPNGLVFTGRSYVVFGKSTPFAATLALASLDGTNGFRLDGVAEGDATGISVSNVGDINKDGIDDLIIGAKGADHNGFVSGSSYVVFGKRRPFTATLDLAGLNGANGFRLDGEAEADESGNSVSAAGDINGDGIDDLIIGAHYSGSNRSKIGRSYVVFGREPSVFANGFE